MDYSEDVFRQILTRAMKIDEERGATYSGDDLTAVGRELGISGQALETARIEVQGQRKPPMARHVIGTGPVRSLLGLAAGGGAIGYICGAALGFGPAAYSQLLGTVPYGVLLMVSGILASNERSTGDHVRFQARNATLWSGVAVGLVLGGRMLHAPESLTTFFIQTVATFMVTTGLVGSVMIGHRRKANKRSDDTGTPRLNWALKCMRRLTNWAGSISDMLQRPLREQHGTAEVRPG